MNYTEQIKSPKWQKKRLKILERDEFTCQNCDSTEKTLNVHHYLYYKDTMIWDYENKYLVTLCDECHKNWHKINEDIKEILLHPTHLLEDVYSLLKIVNQMNPFEVTKLTQVADIMLNLKR